MFDLRKGPLGNTNQSSLTSAQPLLANSVLSNQEHPELSSLLVATFQQEHTRITHTTGCQYQSRISHLSTPLRPSASMTAQDPPQQPPEGAVPEEEVIQSMGPSHSLDISDMPTAPSATGTNTEEALVRSLVAAAHATIAKVDPTNQTTRKQNTSRFYTPEMIKASGTEAASAND